jgi:hypothetical protein
LEIVQKYFDQAIEDKKQLEEKYKQLEAKLQQQFHLLIASQQYREIH